MLRGSHNTAVERVPAVHDGILAVDLEASDAAFASFQAAVAQEAMVVGLHIHTRLLDMHGNFSVDLDYISVEQLSRWHLGDTIV